MAHERLAASEVEQHPQDIVDNREEAEVLREAAGALGEWAEQLPEGSPWRDAFATIGREVRTCVAARGEMHRERVG